MNKIWILIIAIATIAACQSNQKGEGSSADNDSLTVYHENIQESEDAKKWLISAIEEYLKDINKGLGVITTKPYAEYKSDATNTDFDGLTIEEFEKKWKGQFDVQYAGLGSGFMISAQDWSDNLKVTKCELQEKTADGGYLFKIEIPDAAYNMNYNRDIKVIPSGNSFLIADVLEYN